MCKAFLGFFRHSSVVTVVIMTYLYRYLHIKSCIIFSKNICVYHSCLYICHFIHTYIIYIYDKYHMYHVNFLLHIISCIIFSHIICVFHICVYICHIYTDVYHIHIRQISYVSCKFSLTQHIMHYVFTYHLCISYLCIHMSYLYRRISYTYTTNIICIM